MIMTKFHVNGTHAHILIIMVANSSKEKPELVHAQ